jgi:tetratricopeptide (TPR) repeat protein
MVRTSRLWLVALAVVALSAGVAAQGWRGQGRMAGKVTDEAGKPIEGVTVRLYLPSVRGGTDLKTDKKGEWAIGGVAGGMWQIDLIKDGYETRRLSMDVQELEHKPAMQIFMKKAAPDPNEVIAGDMKRAAGLLGEQKFAEARAIYADLLSKYPQAFQILLSMARAYHLEGAHDKEIEEIKQYLEKDPNNVEIKLLAGSEMISKGNAEEGKQLLASIDESKIAEPAVFLNVGINLLNQNKPKDAMTFFDKTVTRFPTYPDGYYYRGIAELQIGSALRPDDQTEGDKFLQAGKADLTKFVEMAPNAPEAATAKKMLEQLK